MREDDVIEARRARSERVQAAMILKLKVCLGLLAVILIGSGMTGWGIGGRRDGTMVVLGIFSFIGLIATQFGVRWAFRPVSVLLRRIGHNRPNGGSS